MNPEWIFQMLAELRALPMFPNDEHVLLALTRLVGSMATNEDQVEWLVARMTSGLYAQWPGPREMRACFCSRYKPADGINAFSGVYLDGIPSERKESLALLNSADAKQIAGNVPEDGQQAGSANIHAALQIGSALHGIRTARFSGPATKEEIRTAPEWLRKLEGYE